MSKIEWTGETWNPIIGCSKVSEGCRNCYAINQAYRNAAIAQTMDNPGRLKYYEGLTEKRGGRIEWTGKVAFVPEALEIPLKRKKPTTWFVNSMSDLFHESVTDEQLDSAFAVMALTPQHTYQVLTKRPERMQEYFNSKAWDGATFGGIALSRFPLPNVWLGVSVENQKAADQRIPLLLQTPAAVRFLSCEPLLEEVEIYEYLNAGFGAPCPKGQRKNAIDWVIIGGESGPGARPFNIEWARSLIRQCQDAGVSVFVKQLGSNVVNLPVHCGNFGRSKGKMNYPGEWPEDIRVREMPQALVFDRCSGGVAGG